MIQTTGTMNHSFLNDNHKNSIIKREILRECIAEGRSSIADLSRALNVSVPTATKLVGELIEEGFLQDEGKIGTSGGRRPNIYDLNPNAGFFVGIDIARHHFHIAISDFKGNIINYIQDIEFVLEANPDSFKKVCHMVMDQVTR